MSTTEHYNQAQDLILKANKILLVSHRRPDGDTLGATVAIQRVLSKMGKLAVPACIDEPNGRLLFLSKLLLNGQTFQRTFDYDSFDLIIISDAGAHHMTGFHELYPDFLSKRVPIINIDHHASNENFGTVNLVDTKAASATVMVYRLFKHMNATIDKEIAIALMTGIYNDTGGMMHSNTNAETYAISAELMKFGFNITEIVRPLLKTATLSQLKLWGHILETMKKNSKDVVSAVVAEEDLKRLHASSGDTGGIIDIMSTITDARFTVLLAEDNGVVKGSLRTQRDDVNLSDLAGQFGGGGHTKASGFRVSGKLEKQTVWRIVPSDDSLKDSPLTKVSM